MLAPLTFVAYHKQRQLHAVAHLDRNEASGTYSKTYTVTMKKSLEHWKIPPHVDDVDNPFAFAPGSSVAAPGQAPETVRIEARTLDGNVFYLTGRDAILHCIMTKNDKGLKLLLKEGHELNKPYQKDGKWSFLHIAAFQGTPEAVKLLIEHGADVNARIDGGPTPLEVATNRARNDIVRLLRGRD